MKTTIAAHLLLLVATLCVAPATAEVTQDNRGFLINHEVEVPTDPLTAHRHLTADIGRWWSSDHTFSGDAGHLRITDDCFCETWDGNRVVHMRVLTNMPGKLLRLGGGLGPLQSLPVVGVMDFTLEGNADTTKVVLSYRVSGFDLEGWASPVDQVLEQQVAAYAAFVAAQD